MKFDERDETNNSKWEKKKRREGKIDRTMNANKETSLNLMYFSESANAY